MERIKNESWDDDKNKCENINTPNKSDIIFALIIGYAITWTIPGSINARVLPLPVCATPNKSLPCNAVGHARLYIRDGLINLGSEIKISIKYFGSPDSSKLCTGLGNLTPVA